MPPQTPVQEPFSPQFGNDFATSREAEDRGWFMKFVAIFGGAMTGGAGIYGLWTGNFTPVIAVWSIAAPFFGAMAAHYFPRSK
jgi:hypothetical protein